MSLGAEDRLHDWLRRNLRQRGYNNVGDDCAILPVGSQLAVTQDHQIEGVHFPADLDPILIAQRLLAVNLSDLAAMGAQPAYAFLALSCPADFDIRRLLKRFLAACDRFGVELAGGDLARNDKVTTSLTLMGRRYKGGRWLRRNQGRPGDQLWLAGDLGLSSLGRYLIDRGASMTASRIRIPGSFQLTSGQNKVARRAIRRHFIPEPQLAVGKWLASRHRVAAIDVSDGTALDLHRLCRESGVGAWIDGDSLFRRGDLVDLCEKLAISPQTVVLTGGEDYALLFTLPPQVTPPAALLCNHVGRLVPGSRVQIEYSGSVHPLPARGWDHFRA